MPSHIPKYGNFFEFERDDVFYNTCPLACNHCGFNNETPPYVGDDGSCEGWRFLVVQTKMLVTITLVHH